MNSADEPAVAPRKNSDSKILQPNSKLSQWSRHFRFTIHNPSLITSRSSIILSLLTMDFSFETEADYENFIEKLNDREFVAELKDAEPEIYEILKRHDKIPTEFIDDEETTAGGSCKDEESKDASKRDDTDDEEDTDAKKKRKELDIKLRRQTRNKRPKKRSKGKQNQNSNSNKTNENKEANEAESIAFGTSFRLL
ncbi:MAG: hypothetical protein AAF438_19985 [Pseudomonadota bacterium]